MEETFLHFLWKFQQFNKSNLSTAAGQPITVFQPGQKNKDAGPDFQNAKIKIGEIIWNGNVEIHVNSKDWFRHNHQLDKSYDNVILHVVWKNDTSVQRKDKTKIPALELKGLVDEQVIENYHNLFLPEDDILCKRFLHRVKSITTYSMLDKSLAQRMEGRSRSIFREMALTDNDWEEIAWRMLCRNFGFKTNAYPFSELGKSLPLKVLKKESEDLKTIEALLFGQAGFLEDKVSDDYFINLAGEYNFKKQKYGLERRLDKSQWKFLRLRPANFPTIRIAQLAAVVARQKNLFSLLTDYSNINELKSDLRTSQSAYWLKHYNFGLQTKTGHPTLGNASIENIIINTVAPLLFAYGTHKGQEELKEKSIQLLMAIKPEGNHIINKWRQAGLEARSAFDSQALIELFNAYCKAKRCLDCTIGTEIVKSK